MLPVIGLLIGLFVGLLLPLHISTIYSSYISIAILACLDSVFGGIRSSFENKFDTTIFISGFFGNAILAAALTYLGDRLNVPIYLAAVVVFGGRLFQNFAVMRREIIERMRNKSRNSTGDERKAGGGGSSEN